MFRFFLSFLGGLFSFVTNGMVMAAILISGVILSYTRDLPDHETLSQYTPAMISRIYTRGGQIMDEFALERRIFTPYEDIPPVVVHAFVSAEDRNFFNHSGYDPRAIAAAIYEIIRSRGQNVRGASTITQQVVKNMLLDGSRRIERKIREVILAARIEQTLSKERIMELYLNEIELGQRSFGVAAAAQTYFNTPLSELRPEQAAYLAALPQSAGTRLHPVRHYDRAISRRNYVLGEMFDNGYLTEEELERALAAPLETVQGGHIEPFRAQLPPRSYFSDEIRRQLSGDFGADQFVSGGYTVRATLDESLQDVAALALRRALERYDRNQGLWREPLATIDPALLSDDEAVWRELLSETSFPRDIEGWHAAVVLEVGNTHARIGIEDIENDEDGHWIAPADVTWARPVDADGNRGSQAQRAGDLLEVGDVVHVRAITDNDGTFQRWSLRQVPEVQGGFMAMDVNTGRVLAMQGGFSYQYSSFNRATQATRQPGSSFKPFVYAAALDSGYSPNTIVIDAPIEVETAEGIWRPQNASNQFYGPSPLRTGIERSRNLMTVRLAQDVGMETVARYAERFGVYDDLAPYLANSLGSQETTLFNMVASYAMFANGGERVEPTLVDRVQDRFGTTVYRHDQRICQDCNAPDLREGRAPVILSNRERVMDAITAYQLTSMMRGVVQRGTASSTVGEAGLGVPLAGKTGTTNDARDVWFVGFSNTIVAGCYIGFDQPRSLGRSASGGGMCGPVFAEFMREAIAEYGGGEFRVPPGGTFYPIDRTTGQRLQAGASGPNVVMEYFRNGEEPFFGALAVVDGGFGLGSSLPMFTQGGDSGASLIDGSSSGGATVTTSTGGTAAVPTNTGFGTLSAGGLY